MRHQKSKCMGWLGGLLLLALTVHAEPAEEAPQAEPGLWDKTVDWVGGAWDRTRDLFRETGEEEGFARIWEDIVPKLEEALTLEDRQRELPEKAWFGEDQRSNRKAVNELLDESIAILSISPSQRYREKIRELEEAVQKTQAGIAELRQKRVSAPRDSTWQKTVNDYDAAIGERLDRIEQLRSELRAVRANFAAELRNLGLEVSDEQLEFLLSTVIGDDLIEMGAAFDNVKDITLQLERLMVESRENLDSARRYYGIYTVLLKVLERMHRHLIDAVDGRYVPEIDAIIARTRELMAETRALQQRSASEQQILAANLEAQQLTLRTADLYRDYLVEQARRVEAARKRLDHDIAIAENTYETVKVSGELVALMQNSEQLLDTLLSRQVPALRTFENLEMKREFEKLTARLRERTAL